MRLTKKEKIKELTTLKEHNVLMTDNDYKELKLGQLEDIEERLKKYKELGINGLIDLFDNLTDDDIEYIVQLAFKKRKIIYEINKKK